MRLRVAARIGEALVFSALAGLFVWVLAVLFTAGLRLPILSPAMLGFLAGGAATQRTLQVTIADRGRRRVLAAACALAGLTTVHGLDYARFQQAQRRWQIAQDYRASDAEIGDRIAAAQRDSTGVTGPPAYFLAALREGAPFVLLHPQGLALALYWAIEMAVALIVAVRWAGGPAPQATASAA